MDLVKIKAFDIFLYRLPLRPLKIGKRMLKVREGLVVRLRDEKGRTGFGEIAPLPGFSRESLAGAIKETRKLRNRLLGKEISESFIHHGLLSVSFGIGTALCGLTSKKIAQKIPVSGLLQGNKSQIVREAKLLVKKGIRTLKIKVGSGSLKQDVEKVVAVKGAVGRHVRLRLDANRAWSLEKAAAFVRAIGRRQIEYIEEPLKNSSALAAFFAKTKMSFALDETLRDLNPIRFHPPKGLCAIVLKPTLLGMDKTFRWIRLAKRKQIKTVISSSFESGLGISALADIAFHVSPKTPAGLDTQKWFKRDVYKKGKLNYRLLRKI